MNGNDTIIGQGSFTQPATAIAQIIAIPQGADWVEVYNWTQSGGTAGSGFRFYWQRPNGANIMGDGTQGIVETSGGAGVTSVAQTAVNAFVLYDPSVQIPGARRAITGFSAADGAIVLAANTTGLADGSIVRFDSLNGAGQQEFGGIDFSVGTITPSTSFVVKYLNSTGSTPSTSGFYRIIPFNPLFYPRRRFITNITAAAQAVITLSVDHGYTVGQKVRLNLVGGAAVWGDWASLSNYNGGQDATTTDNAYTIVAVNVASGTGVANNTITIDANTVGFGPLSFILTWQAIAAAAYTPAEVIPVGEDTSYAVTSLLQQTPQIMGVKINATNTGILADATVNTGFLGMTLAAGALLPAGAANDVIFWKAGISTYGGLNGSLGN